ncbi:MAG TPA: L,D-transpeptidase family protein [Gaiellaceae bacterium]|nr:L,D-transpeptidase family protein [Gaiellaceae bacterium]
MHRNAFVGGAALLAAVAGLAGTANLGSAVADDAPPAFVPTASVSRITGEVFFVRGRRFVPRTRVVDSGEAGKATALRALLAGPTTAERKSGIVTTIPRGTRLVSLSAEDRVATIALRHVASKTRASEVSARPARAAQIVYTLTAFPEVERVLITMNGRPWARFADSRLTIEDPRGRDGLTRPIRLPRKASLVPKGPAPADPAGVQKRLVALRYLPAQAVTGRWDDRTLHAVTAFQAWQRLSRDGIVGAQTLAALETASPPRPAGNPGGGRHVEVYRARGVTLLLDRGRLVRALHSSSGAKGYETPTGSYTIFRKERNSWSVPYRQWLPHASYFNRGIAFHGYPSVPAWPASHGCVRLPAVEAPRAYDFMRIGTSVSVY